MKRNQTIPILLWLLLAVFGIASAQEVQRKIPTPEQIAAMRAARANYVSPVKEILDPLGQTIRIWDWDVPGNKTGDGYDDTWVMQHWNRRYPKVPFDPVGFRDTDPDMDGITSYDEMLFRTDPFKWNKRPHILSPEELRQQALKNEREAAERLAALKVQWAAKKAEREPFLAPPSPFSRKATLEKEKFQKDNAKELLRLAAKVEAEDGTNMRVYGNSANQIESAGGLLLEAGIPYPVLNGSGVTVGVAEASSPFHVVHPDISSRMSNNWVFPDPTNFYAASNNRTDHAIGVVGVLLGSGAGEWNGRGFARGCNAAVSNPVAGGSGAGILSAWNAIAGFPVSNHSYGPTVFTEGLGWPRDSPTDNVYLHFESNPEASMQEPNYCGMYRNVAAFVDQAIFGAPHHLYVQAAGNERFRDLAGRTSNYYGSFFTARSPSGTEALYETNALPYGAGVKTALGRDSIIGNLGKNLLTVGAVNSSDALHTNSGCGPLDDGRGGVSMVSVGVGVRMPHTTRTSEGGPPPPVYSYAHSYTTDDGTSYSAPAVAGTAALMVAHRASTGRPPLLGASLRGILMATAVDIGPSGPDPGTGYGKLHAFDAVAAVRSDGEGSPHIREMSVGNGTGNIIFQVTVTGNSQGVASGPLKVAICWDDVAGPVPPGILSQNDAYVHTLIRDLNVVVIPPGGGNGFLPWALNLGTGTRTRGNNGTDTFELVEIPNPVPGQYTVIVTGTSGALSWTGRQNVSVITLGNNASNYNPFPNWGTGNHTGTPHLERTGVDTGMLTWPSLPGVDYAVEKSTDMVTWTTEVDAVRANGDFTACEVSATDTKAFYRVKDLVYTPPAP